MKRLLLVDVLILRREEEHRRGGDLAQGGAGVHAVHFGHHDIEDDEIEGDALLHLLERLAPVGRLLHDIAARGELQPQHIADIGLVVNHQNSDGNFHVHPPPFGAIVSKIPPVSADLKKL